MASHETLNDLYLDQLRDVYSAERQILDALPDMERAARSGELTGALRTHFQQTEEQVRRLERIFQALGERPGGEKCEAIEGILKEGKRELKNWRDAESKLLDAAIIATTQRVEHYEMAAYGTARALAQQLGRDSDAQLLQQTLEEEKNADRILTNVAASISPVPAAKMGATTGSSATSTGSGAAGAR